VKAKRAIAIRKSMKRCENCQKLPKITVLSLSVDLVLWRRLGTSKKVSKPYSTLIDKFNFNVLEGDISTCRQHRDQIMRATSALYEIEFHRDGSTTEALPRVNPGKSWFTLFWKDPRWVKKSEMGKWLRQAKNLSSVINGGEKLPRMPKNLKGLTSIAAAEQLKWDLESRGYSKVYLTTIGENVVIKRDEDVLLPQGVHAGVPQFTMTEMLRLRHFVGMKPDPQMIQGAWLLKKHLNARVAM